MVESGSGKVWNAEVGGVRGRVVRRAQHGGEGKAGPEIGSLMGGTTSVERSYSSKVKILLADRGRSLFNRQVY